MVRAQDTLSSALTAPVRSLAPNSRLILVGLPVVTRYQKTFVISLPLLKEPGRDSGFLTVYPCNSSNIYAPTLPVLLGRTENDSGDLGWSVGHQPHCLGNSLESMALGLYLRVSETASGVRVGNHCPEVSYFTKNPFRYQFGTTVCKKGSSSIPGLCVGPSLEL